MPHVQIRNMPDELHRQTKARAAAAGVSLSDYLLELVEQAAEQPTIEEWVASVRRGTQLTRLRTRPAALIRADRAVG